MRRAVLALVILVAALAQVTWAPRVEIAGAFPNLVLLVVLAVTAIEGAKSGLVWACVGGVLLDLVSAGGVGPHVLALLFGVYVTGLWTRDLDHISAITTALCAAAATILYSAVLILISTLLDSTTSSLLAASQLALAAAAYNALLAPFVMALGTITRRAQA